MGFPTPFGPYLLLHSVGSGGMADVYLASSTGLGGFEKLLCIKRIRSELADDAQFVELLIEEAKIVSHIVHPNVAQVFDLGKVDGQYYIAMEYVEGVDAFELLTTSVDREVLIPVPAASLIVHSLVSGLAAAHAQTDAAGRPLHIVHRDITPHNVLLSFDGDVKIIDFGVARASLRAEQTAAGVIKGKYNYMSPEQARGERVDHRTDIFSAGIVLFELLAGEPLYAGDKIGQLIEMARKAKVPDVRKLRDDIPPELFAILERALNRDLNKRYQSAAEMASDLEAFRLDEEGRYTRSDLTALIWWLFPEGPITADGAEAMGRGEFQSSSKVSIVTAPGVVTIDNLPPPDPGLPPVSGDIESVPTQLATPEQLRARREQKARRMPEGVASVERRAQMPSNEQADPKGPAARPSQNDRAGRVLLAIGGGGLLLIVLGALVALVLGAREPDVLIVTSEPGDAAIWLDGVPTGMRTPGRLARGVSAGRTYALKVTRPGFQAWETEVTASAGETRVGASLVADSRELVIRSTPSGAQVWVDGSRRGTTPLTLSGLSPVEPVRVELQASGYLPHARVLTWAGQLRAELDVVLSPAPEPE